MSFHPTRIVSRVWQYKVTGGQSLVTAVRRRMQERTHMSNENEDSNKASNRETGQSQDAARHHKDALHHKFHTGPQRSGAAEKNDQGSQARAQQDSVDMQPNDGQPEIPKVGSRDAPGG